MRAPVAVLGRHQWDAIFPKRHSQNSPQLRWKQMHMDELVSTQEPGQNENLLRRIQPGHTCKLQPYAIVQEHLLKRTGRSEQYHYVACHPTHLKMRSHGCQHDFSAAAIQRVNNMNDAHGPIFRKAPASTGYRLIQNTLSPKQYARLAAV
jgi:hypothetical protein